MTTRISARPATAPTTPPTNAGVDGELPPPEAAAAVEDEAGAPPPVLVGPPAPPTAPVPSLVLLALAEDEDEDDGDDVIEDETEEVVDDRVLVASVELRDVAVEDVLTEFEGVEKPLKKEDEDEDDAVEFELAVGVMRTGNVVTRVDPEIVCEDVTTKSMYQYRF